MGERWDTAVAAAAEEPPADLRAAVEEELIALWNDLHEALQRAAGRRWSAECDGLVVRIVMLSRLSAATSWPWIPAPLLASGIYQGILTTANISFTPPPSRGSTAWTGATKGDQRARSPVPAPHSGSP
jgi:hypothetical protein